MTHLCCVLHTKEEKLCEILSRIDSYYYEQRHPKFKKNGDRKLNKDGTPRDRIINPSIKELNAIQDRLNKFLASNITPADYSFGAVKKRDNVKNAKIHRGNKYFFQTDLQDFFPFVTCKKVYYALIFHGFSPDVASKITKLTTYKGHLPQGASTSSTLANFVFSFCIGGQIDKFAQDNKLRFTIFVDDVTLSASYDFKDKTAAVLEMIHAGGFRISHTKTTYRVYSDNITGVKMGQNYLNVTDNFRAKLNDSENKSDAQIKGEKLYEAKVRNAN